jgi:hypothetical protein
LPYACRNVTRVHRCPWVDGLTKESRDPKDRVLYGMAILTNP